MAINRAFSVLALIFATSCAGKYPMASSRRPLLLPDGEHEFALSLGKYRRLRPYNFAPSNDWHGQLGYRYGVSDRVNYVFPFVWTHGWKLGDGFELEGFGGISGFGYGSMRQHPWSGDPREPIVTARGMLYTTVLGAMSRLELGDSLSLLGRASADLNIFFIRPRNATLLLSGALVYDLHEYWSFGLSAGTGLSGDWDEGEGGPWIRLGRGPGPLIETPLVALHLVRSLDLTASPYLEYKFSDDILDAGVEFGVDWYFD